MLAVHREVSDDMNYFKQRRGVATIVGMFFFVVIMAAALAAFSAAFLLQENMINTQLKVTQQNIVNLDEDFVITTEFDITDSNRLCLNIENTGSEPLQIVDIWIVNKTDPYPANRYEIDYTDMHIPISSISNMLEDPPLYLTEGTYEFKVVTKSGTIKTTELVVPNTSNPDTRLEIEVSALVPSINSGDNTILMMHVYNRGNTTLTDVQPNGNFTTSPDTYIKSSTLLSPSSGKLGPNGDIIFSWKNKIQGSTGSSVTFNASAKARIADKVACNDNSFIFSDYDTASLFLARASAEDVAGKPDIFGSIPSPFGSVGGTKTGHFGVVIINPTNNNMEIFQVAIQVIVEGGAQVFKVDSVVGVEPTTGWTDSLTLLSWKDATTPIVIAPHGAEQWIARIQPISVGDLPTNAVIFNTYTSYGQYSKGTIDTMGVAGANAPIVEVHQSTDNPGTDHTYLVKGRISDENKQYNVTIANAGDETIDSGSYLLVTIPPAFTDLTNGTFSAGLLPESTITFDDGSQQVPVKLTTDMTTGTSRTYSFTTTTPIVEETTMYLITITGTGTVTDAIGGTHLIGAVGQTIVQVCPDASCP